MVAAAVALEPVPRALAQGVVAAAAAAAQTTAAQTTAAWTMRHLGGESFQVGGHPGWLVVAAAVVGAAGAAAELGSEPGIRGEHRGWSVGAEAAAVSKPPAFYAQPGVAGRILAALPAMSVARSVAVRHAVASHRSSVLLSEAEVALRKQSASPAEALRSAHDRAAQKRSAWR